MDLLLEPDDGRETGLRLPRHTFTSMPQPEPSPYARLLDDVIRALAADYSARVDAAHVLAVAQGLQLEEVEPPRVVPDEMDGDDQTRIRVVGTYRLVRRPSSGPSRPRSTAP